MLIKVTHLSRFLQNDLAKIYLVYGDEPLQIAEATDDIRLSARQSGYNVREVINIDQGNEWYKLKAEAGSLSIFSDQKLIDLRVPSGKPGLEGSKALLNYCENCPDQTILLISMGKLEKESNKSKWYQTIDKEGVIVQVWPIQRAELTEWLERRVQRKGMLLDKAAIQYLANRIEGNLLAAAQEIEKLYILYGCNPINAELIEMAVADNSRYDVFKFTETILNGKINRAIKILHGLQSEGIAATIVLWALTRETRVLFNILSLQKKGYPLENIFTQLRITEKAQQPFRLAVQRLKYHDVLDILKTCALTDQQIKGQLSGNPWESFFNICLRYANLCIPNVL